MSTDYEHPTDAILGDSKEVAALRAQIRRLAAFDAPGNPRVPTVLLQGETGTGKGLVARAVHDSGPRAGGPFIDVNCAAIPETMLEAELFGFEAGAFTDAKRAKPGLFEAASGGTLFLDEVDSLSIPVQSKVLKAIEEKRVRRLGAVVPHDFDVKLVAATQKELKALVAAGVFRADLYHRLAVLILTLPALRQRDDDVQLLADHFLRWYAETHGITPKHLNASARAWLSAYEWPGNVRELGHLMERVTLLSPDDDVGRETLDGLAGALVSPADRAPAVKPEPMTAPAEETADEAARISAALARAGGNVVRAARILGIGRNALRYRMRRLDIGRGAVAEIAAAVPQALRDPTPTPSAAPATQPFTWEEKAVAVLVLALTFPESGDAPNYEPWTLAMRWDRVVGEKVEGFGGVFVQRSPSRVTAVFGLPRALEQTPQRAVQAALAIQRAVAHAAAPRPDFSATVHIGDVRVDTAARDPLARLLPIGDAFALPERLLGHAGAGEVLVSPQVARRVEATCETEARTLQLGPNESARMTAYAVLRPRAPVTAEPAMLTRFVGRQREIELLSDAFERAAAGAGQVVFITGEAGIGKSRLLDEFRRRIARHPHGWIEGRCAAYGASTPFLPVIDALRRLFGIDDEDDEASATAKIAHEVAALGQEVAWTVPFIQQMLSLEVADDTVRALDSASRRSELFRALRVLTLRQAERAPLVLVVEDLHWIDPASEEYIAFVADAIPTMRALLILSHRSGHPACLPDRSYHRRVALAPLSGGEMAEMAGAILGTLDVPPALHTLVAQKAEGNPFFVEELARQLFEEGAVRRDNGQVVLARNLAEITVPDTIQDVLIARIDRLAEESRRAIQVASVIGREFALRLLARITEAGERLRSQVEELQSLELIYEKALHPELAYMFKHALTHDVAYESVVLERRKFLHRTVGLAIEELYADRLAEHYETLVHHFSRGEDWERALLYCERSADKAAATHANRAVVDYCRQALALADRLGARVPAETRCRINERLGRAHLYLSEYAASGAAYEEAAAQCAAPEAHALHLAAAGFSHLWAHRYEPSRRCIDAALTCSRERNVAPGEAMALAVDGFYRAVHDADLDGSARSMQTAVEICGRHPHEAVEAFARFNLVMISEWTGAYDRALQLAERAIALGRKLRAPEIIILPTWFLGKARGCRGDYGGAIAILEDAYQLCDRIGDRAWKSRLLNTLGWCFAEVGNTERALDYNQRAAVLAREIGDPEILSNADVNLATNYLARGDLDRAAALIEPIEAALAQPGDPWMRWRYALHVHHARGQLELARGAPDAALAQAEEELRGAQQHRVPKVEARASLLRAAALLATDRHEDAARALQDALAIAGRIGYRRAVWQGHRLLAEAARRAGDGRAAAEHLARARAAAEEAARSLTDAGLRRTLIASALGDA